MIKGIKCWALVHADGEIHPAWFYSKKKLLKECAPGEITGQPTTWAQLKARGYRIARVEVTVKKECSE